MNELFKVDVDNDRLILSARDLYEFIGLEERFSKWWERMVSYGFDEGIEYTPYQKVHPQNNQEITDYQITIEMAKEIAMLQRNEKGKEARQYFIEIEKEWNNPDRIMERALSIARKRIDDLKVELELQRPKIDFYDTVAGSKDAVEMGNVAKVLNINGIGRNNLFEFLRNQKYYKVIIYHIRNTLIVAILELLNKNTRHQWEKQR